MCITAVSSEESKRYTAIVDAILATADLETVSRKKIRQGLEKALGGQDLGAQKVLAILLDDGGRGQEPALCRYAYYLELSC